MFPKIIKGHSKPPENLLQVEPVVTKSVDLLLRKQYRRIRNLTVSGLLQLRYRSKMQHVIVVWRWVNAIFSWCVPMTTVILLTLQKTSTLSVTSVTSGVVTSSMTCGTLFSSVRVDGNAACGVGVPEISYPDVSWGRCSAACRQETWCSWFNHVVTTINDVGLCELFDRYPRVQAGTRSGCMLFKV